MLYVHTLTCLGARGFPFTFLLLFFGLWPGHAGEFPDKPVKVVVPFGPGGASDVLARTVQEAIRREGLSPHPWVILNVPGAGGSLGSYKVKNARPDGYTILNLHDGLLTAKHQGVTTYGAEAFQPIGTTGSSHTVVCSGPHLDFANLRTLLDGIAANPSTLRFGANLGAPSHFVGLLLERQRSGAAFRFVAAGGGSSRFSDLAGGHLDVSIFSLSEYLQFREGGLQALGYLGPERHPVIPEVPTARELGIDLVTGTTQFWWAPAGTPPDRVAKLADILEAAMQSEWLRSEYERLSVIPEFHRGSEMEALVAERDRQLAKVAIRGETYSLPVGGVVGICLAISAIWALAGNRPPSSPFRWNRPSLTIAAGVVVYVLVLGLRVLPFWVCTILFAGLTGWILATHHRERMLAILTALVLTTTLHVLFQGVLRIDLP